LTQKCLGCEHFAAPPTVLAILHCAGRRDVEGQMSLFTPDKEFLVYMESRKDEVSQ
jgi:hypothetical protein